MIRKFLAKVFRGTRARRNVSTTKKRVRRIAIEPLESRRLLAVTGSLSGFAYLDIHDFGTKNADEAGFAGLTVRLKDVSGVGPVQTLADGSYHFNGLAAGTYQIQISPSSKLAVGSPSAGSAGGTVGSNEIQVTLAADQIATDYNFAILGAQSNQISLRLFMASSNSLTNFLTTLHTKPSVSTGTNSSLSFTTTYTTGGPAVAVVSANATLTATDSPTLTAMTVTLQNPLDGSSEQLSADTTGTRLTSNYANNVLTVSGVADLADYRTVLQRVRYHIASWPAQVGNRTLSIVINDGTATSTAATSTIDVVQGTQTTPSVTSIGPSSGPAIGGTVVTINGSGFTAASTVQFGTAAATSVVYVSATQITATAPVGVGVVDITVTTSGNTSATSASDQFSYVPSVTSISPSSGPATGGSVVTINGSGFTAGSTAKFGTAAATGVVYVSATQITATSPAGVGVVDVTVTTSGSTSVISGSDQFSYVPSVTSISPSSGQASGGTVVTINGSGFTAASTAKFGTTAATGVAYISSTQITATAPVGAVGTVDITVTTAGTTSTTSASDQFGYTVYPSGYAFTVDQSVYNLTTGKSAGFTITNAKVGATLTYLIVGNLSGYVINHIPVTSATQNVTGIDITSLSAGQVTFLISLSDAGNEGPQLVAYATLDKTTVTPDQSTINAVAVNSTGFTLGGVEVGASYSYTISNVSASPIIIDGAPIIISGASVTGSGIVTSANQDITGINLSTLANGAITFSVTVTDLAGHTGSPVTAQATIDRTVPTAIAISASVAPADQSGVLVGLLQTVGPQSLASYTYSLVSVDGSTDTASFPFHISGDELLTSAVLSSVGHPSYSIRVRSTDLQGKFIEQSFLITVSGTNPVTPILGLDNTFIPVGPSNTTVGTLSTTAPSGGILPSQTSYSLVSGTGSTNNSSFQIVNANGTQLLKTASALSAGVYSVRVRSSGTFLISDVVNIGGISGPYAYQVSFDPTKLPSSNYSFLSANAGLISLASDPTAGSWYPAVSQNKEVAGSLAQPNYLGSYSSFWASVTAANPTATLKDVVGSSGVDLASNTAWAVVDRSGEYAVGVQVFTERTFTITVTLVA